MTLAVPYEGSASSKVQEMVLGRKYPERPLDAIRDDEVGNLLWRLLFACWSYNPEDRPSATDVSRYMNKLALGQISDYMRFTRATMIEDVVGIFTQYGLIDYTNELVHIPSTAYVEKQSAKIHRVDLLIRVNQPSSYKELKRSTREAHFWSKHNHENILLLLGFAVLDNQLTMISPWMEYGSITEYVDSQPKPDYHDLCIQLSSAVAYLHENKLVHGDIKGDNLLVSRNGTVKVIDFGVSIMAQLEIEFTQTSTGRGSVRYQAPEILKRKTDSTREGDVYALGMTMVEIYTHARPYGNKEIGYDEIYDIIRGILRPGPPRRLPLNSRGKRTWKIMEDCWEGDPAARLWSSEVYERV
ncbi:hypothetical protein RSOLAG22IIIB_08005 [Rhizoctonia solani]|uniref:Protein kinase domain-containing protein n=1 Tax=Rhizoctonia solani TaxID=456999 RepID=A0A0K6FQV3_9AGAM|nr:hypothetical protein RSOLAG22IIIB_08005 [Rhizoctonia solani]